MITTKGRRSTPTTRIRPAVKDHRKDRANDLEKPLPVGVVVRGHDIDALLWGATGKFRVACGRRVHTVTITNPGAVPPELRSAHPVSDECAWTVTKIED